MNPRAIRMTKVAAVTATTLALALGMAACNDDVSATSATSPATGVASHPAGAAAAGGAAATGKPAGKSTFKPAPAATPVASSAASAASAASTRCHTGDLKADIQLQPDAGNSAMVMLTNKSSRTCTVYGYLGYGGERADNSTVALKTNRVANPGAPMLITLAPGTTAFSGLKWSSCDKADTSCSVISTVTVTPPDETTQLVADVLDVNAKAPEQLTVSAAGFTVGSLQPITDGVVFNS